MQLLTNFNIDELNVTGCGNIVESATISNTKKLNVVVNKNTTLSLRECIMIISSDDKYFQVKLQQNGEEFIFKFIDTNTNITFVRFPYTEVCFEKEYITSYSDFN